MPLLVWVTSHTGQFEAVEVVVTASPKLRPVVFEKFGLLSFERVEDVFQPGCRRPAHEQMDVVRRLAISIT